MKLASKLLSAAGTAALMGLAASPAFAAGTTAGSSIVNTASVNFQVGGVAQTAQTASNTIVVDEKVVLTAVNNGTVTSVSPGQTGAVSTFTVTNSSNAPLEIGLSAVAQTVGGADTPGTGTSAVTATGFTYFTNTNGSSTCSYSAANATAIASGDITSLAADGTECVYVLANIPIAATSGQNAAIDLTATAESAVGVPLTQSNSTVAWTPGTKQIVFADAAGNGGDAAYDGKYTALGDYLVAAPVLSVTKISWIVSDPVDGTTHPKAIPGATMAYCIIVANASTATASATGVSISDPLPATVTYVTGTNKLVAPVAGTAPTTTCSGGSAGSDAVAGTVSGTLATLPAGDYEAMWFTATIN